MYAIGSNWEPICSLDALTPERGVAALLSDTDSDAKVQIAVIRTYDDKVFGVQQLDPYSGANVMSRGIVGDYDARPTIASPVYKQTFDLETGICVNPQGSDRRNLKKYPIIVHDGTVYAAFPHSASAADAADMSDSEPQSVS